MRILCYNNINNFTLNGGYAVLHDFSHLDLLLCNGINDRAFPSAVCAVGDRDGVYYTKAVGYSRVFDDALPCFDVRPEVIPQTAVPADTSTLYDLASLTKMTAASMCALRLIETGVISLYDTVGMFIDAPGDKRDITIKQLMSHTSGISAHFHLSKYTDDPAGAVDVILNRPLAYPTGSKVEYSCMGYILLGALLTKAVGMNLDRMARELVFEPLGMPRTMFRPLDRGEKNIAVTEFDTQNKRYLCGEVHDENARFLGGVSANAGLYSDIGDMTKFALMLANRGETENGRYLSRRMFDTAVTCHTVGLNESRGLGFVVKGDGVSAMGELFARGSYGHTGYTGTSLFVDSESGIFSVLLTNRVHYTRQSSRIMRFRRLWHNAVIGCFR